MLKRTGLVLLVASVVAAGCVEGSVDDVDDVDDMGVEGWVAHGARADAPAGDARERPGHALFVCGLAGCPDAPGMEARPVAFPDLVGITIVGEDDALVVDVEFARLDEVFVDLDRGDDFHRLAKITTCLETSRGEQCMVSFASTSADGASVETSLIELDEDCNEWHACAWQVPTQIMPGEPGALRLTVPKAYLFGDEDALSIQGVHATARVHAFEPGLPGRHVAATAFHADQHWHEHGGPFSGLFGEVVDRVEPQDVDVVLRPAPPPEPRGPVMVAGPGNKWGGGSPHDHPRHDLRAVDFEEDEEALTVTFTVADWDGSPLDDMHHVILFGTLGGTVQEVGVLKEGGAIYAYVGHCITFSCTGPYRGSDPAHNHGGWQERLPLDEGDATLSVRVPWTHLPTIGPGDRLSYLLAMTMHMDLGVYVGDYGDETHGDVHMMAFMDYVEGVQPYVFRHGAAEPGHVH